VVVAVGNVSPRLVGQAAGGAFIDFVDAFQGHVGVFDGSPLVKRAFHTMIETMVLSSSTTSAIPKPA